MKIVFIYCDRGSSSEESAMVALIGRYSFDRFCAYPSWVESYSSGCGMLCSR